MGSSDSVRTLSNCWFSCVSISPTGLCVLGVCVFERHLAQNVPPYSTFFLNSSILRLPIMLGSILFKSDNDHPLVRLLHLHRTRVLSLNTLTPKPTPSKSPFRAASDHEGTRDLLKRYDSFLFLYHYITQRTLGILHETSLKVSVSLSPSHRRSAHFCQDVQEPGLHVGGPRARKGGERQAWGRKGKPGWAVLGLNMPIMNPRACLRDNRA